MKASGRANTGDNRITLHDGRSLGFCQYGDPGGRPVFYFHGFPGSRLEAKFAERSGVRLNARIIAADRPGFGLSDFKQGRTIVDWPGDVTELADALGIGRFSVIGASGGGPYAAACAFKIPHRLTSVGIVCGLGPLDAPGATDGMAVTNRLVLRLCGRATWIARSVCALAALAIRRNSERIVDRLAAKVAGPDKVVLRRPEVRQLLRDSFREAVRAGPSGMVRDLMLYSHRWGFRLQDILMEVHLWQGELDAIVPPPMGRYQAKTVPRCRATFYANEGHFSLIANHLDEILASLIAG